MNLSVTKGGIELLRQLKRCKKCCQLYLLKSAAFVQVKAQLIGKTEVRDKLGQAVEGAATEMK